MAKTVNRLAAQLFITLIPIVTILNTTNTDHNFKTLVGGYSCSLGKQRVEMSDEDVLIFVVLSSLGIQFLVSSCQLQEHPSEPLYITITIVQNYNLTCVLQ